MRLLTHGVIKYAHKQSFGSYKLQLLAENGFATFE